MNDGDWLSTDEAEDVAGSVRHALLAHAHVDGDRQAWKWVALAVHSALQGACVCHLTTTAAPFGAVTSRNAAEWLGHLERLRDDPQAPPPPTRLMPLPALLRAVRRPRSAGDRSNPAGIPLTDAELAWLCRFHEQVRNQFTHFAPMGWSLEVSGMPGLAARAARMIGDMLEAGWAFRHTDAAWRAGLADALTRLAGLADHAPG